MRLFGWEGWEGNPDLLQSLCLLGRLASATFVGFCCVRTHLPPCCIAACGAHGEALGSSEPDYELNIYSISGLYIYRPFSVPVLGL